MFDMFIHMFTIEGIDPILLDYENGKIDDRTVTSKIFGMWSGWDRRYCGITYLHVLSPEILFGRDFSGGGKHWSYDGQSIDSIDPPEGGLRCSILSIAFLESSSTARGGLCLRMPRVKHVGLERHLLGRREQGDLFNLQRAEAYPLQELQVLLFRIALMSGLYSFYWFIKNDYPSFRYF